METIPKLPTGIAPVDPDQIYLDWVEWSKTQRDSVLKASGGSHIGTDSVYAEWSDYQAEQKMKELLLKNSKCECGVVAAMGDAYKSVSDFHSDYCPCSKLPKMQVPDDDK